MDRTFHCSIGQYILEAQHGPYEHLQYLGTLSESMRGCSIFVNALLPQNGQSNSSFFLGFSILTSHSLSLTSCQIIPQLRHLKNPSNPQSVANDILLNKANLSPSPKSSSFLQHGHFIDYSTFLNHVIYSARQELHLLYP